MVLRRVEIQQGCDTADRSSEREQGSGRKLAPATIQKHAPELHFFLVFTTSESGLSSNRVMQVPPLSLKRSKVLTVSN